ncbi:MAG: hypothetical protein EOP47_20770 [Sphingobacteriaceae bacterium]|nr:MAG: hypothetical protein EOP47_20770 [Sphingobacteriaceae bacterium]
MLAAIFFILSWYAFFQPQRVYGLLASYPFILRMGVPFYYLIPPFVFWYTRIKFWNKQPKGRYLIAHLLLFFIGILDISWYYIRDYHRLHDIALGVAQNFGNLFTTAEGFLPAATHYIIRPVQGCIYCICSCYLCYSAYRLGKFKTLSLPVCAWIVFFNLIMAAIYFMLFHITIIDPPEDFPVAGYYQGRGAASFMVFLFCLLGAALFFYPSIIYGRKNNI